MERRRRRVKIEVPANPDPRSTIAVGSGTEPVLTRVAEVPVLSLK